jgi:hypothetical protein
MAKGSKPVPFDSIGMKVKKGTDYLIDLMTKKTPKTDQFPGGKSGGTTKSK